LDFSEKSVAILLPNFISLKLCMIWRITSSVHPKTLNKAQTLKNFDKDSYKYILRTKYMSRNTPSKVRAYIQEEQIFEKIVYKRRPIITCLFIFYLAGIDGSLNSQTKFKLQWKERGIEKGAKRLIDVIKIYKYRS